MANVLLSSHFICSYDEFHPFLFEQHKLQTFKEFESFDASVDEFFSAIESQRLEVKKRSQEEHAQKKLDGVRMEHLGRVRGLEEAQQLNVLRAELIEANLEMCDQAIMIIRNAVATGMDWKDLADLVEEERKHNNPIALMIDALKLESNQVCVILSDPYDEEEYDGQTEEEENDDEDEDDNLEAEDRHQPKAKPTVLVDLDIYLTAFANARKYYEVKKLSAIKQEKTLAHASKAFKSAEKKIRQQLQEVKITTSIQRARKPYWFEKFMWFITSENYLVIAGRDAQQNEMIVKRYMKKGDVYVHADIHGAATVLIKNPSDKDPVPPSSLYQAGIMSVCQSKAWDAKIVTSAYWVNADQVSKSAPTGEYLTTGSFMIRGKKNFLPPVQLVYGFGFLFKLDESSIGNHLNERHAPKLEEIDGSENSNVVAHATAMDAVNDHKGEYKEADQQEDEPVGHDDLEGSDGSDEDNDESEDRSENTVEPQETESQGADTPKSVQSHGDESESESESEAAESSDEEFPDTQIQFNKSSSVHKDFAPVKPAADKYALQDYGDDSNDEGEKGGDDTSSLASSDRGAQKSAYITAKMRRVMKKGKVPGSQAAEGEEDQHDDIVSPKPVPAKKAQQQSQQGGAKKGGAPTAPTPPPISLRGKKGKAKKMKEKYGDQDEEERLLRLELLAVSLFLRVFTLLYSAQLTQ